MIKELMTSREARLQRCLNKQVALHETILFNLISHQFDIVMARIEVKWQNFMGKGVGNQCEVGQSATRNSISRGGNNDCG